MNGDVIKVGLYGIGKSNIALKNYLSQHYKCKFTLRADKPCSVPDWVERAYFGTNVLDDLCEDILFLSPSVRRQRREIEEAILHGLRVSSDCEMYYELCGAPQYAVTGSDGKSTTTYLIADMLSRSGKAALPAGNFGQPLIELCGSSAIAVAELSSFQLTYAVPTVHRAVITNISPNHLDWHKSFDEYSSAKLALGRCADGCIIDADCELLMSLTDFPPEVAVSLQKSEAELMHTVKAQHYMTYRNGKLVLDGKQLLDVTGAIKLEEHNLKNYMLAAAAVTEDATADAIREAIVSFRGLPHRAETVAVFRGIEFIDSSIDTSPTRTLATLSSYGDDTAVIICGRSKGFDYAPLAKALPEKTCGAVLMGEVGACVAPLISDAKYPKVYAESMADAVAYAADMLGGSGRVILSPAGTSYDKYENYIQRGTDFTLATKKYITSKDV